MNTYTLPFGDITILQENLAEIVVNEGIIIDEDIVNDYHNFLISNLKPPFSLMVNKKFAYSYTYEALLKIHGLDQIDKIAVVAYSSFTEMATKFLIDINTKRNWKVRIFQDQDLALNWLNKPKIKKAAI
ncbi:DUF7793 family protein [Flavobacteriaceae bacterium LMO-SS05]